MSNQSRAQISGFTQNFTTSPAPVSYNMGQGIVGSYSNLLLKPRGNSTWRKYPNSPPLLKGKIFPVFGAGVPLHSTAMDPPEDSMFMFSRNISSPACCPSTFSDSRGCLCLNKAQRDLIGVYRGGNRTILGDNEY